MYTMNGIIHKYKKQHVQTRDAKYGKNLLCLLLADNET